MLTFNDRKPREQALLSQTGREKEWKKLLKEIWNKLNKILMFFLIVWVIGVDNFHYQFNDSIVFTAA